MVLSYMAIRLNDCLVNVVRKQAKFSFLCPCNHYMMCILPFSNVLAVGALTPLRLIQKLRRPKVDTKDKPPHRDSEGERER